MGIRVHITKSHVSGEFVDCFDKLMWNKMHAFERVASLYDNDDKNITLRQYKAATIGIFIDSIYRLAILRRVGLQHVGYIQSDCCCCVDMKQIRASVHREARFHIRGCANQSNNNDNDHVIMQMEKSTLMQLQRHQPRCPSKFCDPIPATIQQLFRPAQAVSTTMLHVLYLSALYLVVATNVCVSGAAAAAATGSGAVATVTSNSTVATFIASNKLSGENDIQRNGPVYAALSGAHSNVPTTIDPSEYILYHSIKYIKNGDTHDITVTRHKHKDVHMYTQHKYPFSAQHHQPQQ